MLWATSSGIASHRRRSFSLSGRRRHLVTRSVQFIRHQLTSTTLSRKTRQVTAHHGLSTPPGPFPIFSSRYLSLFTTASAVVPFTFPLLGSPLHAPRSMLLLLFTLSLWRRSYSTRSPPVTASYACHSSLPGPCHLSSVSSATPHPPSCASLRQSTPFRGRHQLLLTRLGLWRRSYSTGPIRHFAFIILHSPLATAKLLLPIRPKLPTHPSLSRPS